MLESGDILSDWRHIRSIYIPNITIETVSSLFISPPWQLFCLLLKDGRRVSFQSFHHKITVGY